MAVIDVKEKLEQTGAEVSTDGAADVRIFTVKFDTADDPIKRRLIALFAKDPSTGLQIPRVYQSHPYDYWLYVKNKYAKPLAPFLYEVTVNYTVAANDQQISEETNPFGNPLDQEPEVSWGFAMSNEQIDRDINGKPILNSANQPFDPPITKDKYDLVLRIVRNEESYDRFLAAEYIGAVNNDDFYGYPANTVKCIRFDADRRRTVDLIYYQVHYEFQIRFQKVQDKLYGWTRRIRDEGYVETKKPENLSDPPDLEVNKDIDIIPLGQPVLLDGNGRKLSQEKIDALEVVWLPFDVDDKLPFSVLRL